MTKKNRKAGAESVEQNPVLMTLENLDVDNIPEGGAILRIPCDQLFRDENQPRRKFKKTPLAELAESIRTQGLQQYPVVNFWKIVDGKKLFKMKAGERRLQAHVLLGKPNMTCIVEPGKYSEVYDVDRALAQAAENSSREPHTVSEIVHIVKNVIADEKKKRVGSGGTEHGAIDIALRKVEKAFGKKQGWAASYHQLGRLSDELLDMLDSEDDSEPSLRWGDAIALVTADKEEQVEILKEAHAKFPSNPNARKTFISREARARRVSRGEKVKGRSYDEKERFLSYCNQLRSLGERASEGRSNVEGLAYMKKMLASMRISEIEQVLSSLRVGLGPFVPLYREAKVARDKKLEQSDLKFVPEAETTEE